MEGERSHISHVGYVELPEQTPKALEAPPGAPRTAPKSRTLAGVERAWLNSPTRPHAHPRPPQPHRTGLAKPLALGTGKRPVYRERIKIYRATERERGEPTMNEDLKAAVKARMQEGATEVEAISAEIEEVKSLLVECQRDRDHFAKRPVPTI